MSYSEFTWWGLFYNIADNNRTALLSKSMKGEYVLALYNMYFLFFFRKRNFIQNQKLQNMRTTSCRDPFTHISSNRSLTHIPRTRIGFKKIVNHNPHEPMRPNLKPLITPTTLGYCISPLIYFTTTPSAAAHTSTSIII